MKKGLASVEQHIRREFERVRIIEHIVTKEAEGQTPQVERIAFTLERRAESIVRRVPVTLIHRGEHEGPWDVCPPRMSNQNDLDALFNEALKSLGYGPSR
jgi:hypothetical protein